MGIIFWCLLRFVAFSIVGFYISMIFGVFLLGDYPRFYLWLPPVIIGLLMMLFGVGLWGRWRYLWVFVSLLLALAVFPWVADRFFWYIDLGDHPLLWLCTGACILGCVTAFIVRFSYRRWPVQPGKYPYSFFKLPSAPTKVATVLIGIAATAYCWSYIYLSVRGQYEPEWADLTGVKGYCWGPKGFFDKFIGNSPKITFYYGLWNIDKMFWHASEHWEDLSKKYPVDAVSPDDLGKLYKEWDRSAATRKTSTDDKYQIWVGATGIRGSAFIDRTSKTIRITIVKNIKRIDEYFEWDVPPMITLFTNEYHFECADVFFDTSWNKENNVAVTVYDYAPDVYQEDARRAGSPSNYIATISLVLDKQSGKFREKKSQNQSQP